jgi:DNA polymerase III epsilon subunit-like protein
MTTFAAIDFETANTSPDSACAVGVAVVQDDRIIRREHRLRRSSYSFVCTVHLARTIWRVYPAKLPDVCRHLRIPLRHHEAGSDAEACARIVIAARKAGWERRVRS